MRLFDAVTKLDEMPAFVIASLYACIIHHDIKPVPPVILVIAGAQWVHDLAKGIGLTLEKLSLDTLKVSSRRLRSELKAERLAKMSWNRAVKQACVLNHQWIQHGQSLVRSPQTVPIQ